MLSGAEEMVSCPAVPERLTASVDREQEEGRN